MSLPHDRDTQPTSSTTSIDRRATTRSPSPKIAFVSTNFPPRRRSKSPGQATAVQNITRQVIRRLSSLQHVEVLEMLNENEHDDDELLSGRDTPSTASPPREGSPGIAEEYTNGVGHEINGRVGNGTANGKVQASAKKIDWEIPRKVLHSSIGACVVGTTSWNSRLISSKDSSHYTCGHLKAPLRRLLSFSGQRSPLSCLRTLSA